MYFVYLLKCRDGTLYCGYSNHVEKRVKAHNEGKGARYTKARRPVKLIYSEKFDSRGGAMKRELEIKSLPAKEKWRLVSMGKSSILSQLNKSLTDIKKGKIREAKH